MPRRMLTIPGRGPSEFARQLVERHLEARAAVERAGEQGAENLAAANDALREKFGARRTEGEPPEDANDYLRAKLHGEPRGDAGTAEELIQRHIRLSAEEHERGKALLRHSQRRR